MQAERYEIALMDENAEISEKIKFLHGLSTKTKRTIIRSGRCVENTNRIEGIAISMPGMLDNEDTNF